MSHYIYSTEALPDPELMGQPGYTPDQEYIRWGGLTLPAIPEKKWTKLPDVLETIRRTSWRDPKQEIEIRIEKFAPIIRANFAKRGVIFLDHEPSEAEKKKLEAVSAELCAIHRKKAVEFFEQQRDVARDQKGQYFISPYVDKCYAALGLKKPYSLDAIEAQRDPGGDAARKIADAITEANKPLVEMLTEALTKPQNAQPPQHR